MNRVENAMKTVDIVITKRRRFGGSMKFGTTPGGGAMADPSSKA